MEKSKEKICIPSSVKTTQVILEEQIAIHLPIRCVELEPWQYDEHPHDPPVIMLMYG